MWWLRELRYTLVGKLLLFVLVAGVVSGMGFFAYKALGTSLNDEIIAESETQIVEGGVVSIPMTTKQLQCKAAIEQLDRIIKKTTKFSNIDSGQSDLAFQSYAKAVRTCTYNEFIDFERTTVNPWMGGQDMYNAAEKSGDLEEAPTETTVGGSK
jgi:hypothetical protein